MGGASSQGGVAKGIGSFICMPDEVLCMDIADLEERMDPMPSASVDLHFSLDIAIAPCYGGK